MVQAICVAWESAETDTYRYFQPQLLQVQLERWQAVSPPEAAWAWPGRICRERQSVSNKNRAEYNFFLNMD